MFLKINIVNPLMTAWNTQAIGWCKRADVENVLLPAWSRLNSRERQVSLWCFDYWLWKFLPFSSRTSRLCSSQSLIIFSLPIVMCSLSLPWIPLCIRLLPTFLPSHCLFLFPYYCKEEEKIREGGRKCKYRSVVLSFDRSGLIIPTSPLHFGPGRSPFCFSLLLVSITLWSLLPPVNPPPPAPRLVKRWEQPGDQRGISGCRAQDLLYRWSWTG